MAWKAAAIGLQHGHINGFLTAMQKHPKVELVAVAEAERAVRERYAREYGVPAYSSARELLEKHRPEVVGSAPIHSEAAGIVCEALRAGAHVILDKPVYSLKHLEEVRQAQAETGREFWLMLTGRYWAAARAMKELYRAGRLGKLVNLIALGPHKLTLSSRPAWMFDSSKYLGVIADLTIHYLDALRWVTGEEVRELSAYHGNFRFAERRDFTDYGEVIARTRSGGAAFIRVDWLTPDASPLHGDYRFILLGTEGYVEVRLERDVLGKEQTPCVLSTNSAPPEAVPLPEIKRDLYEDFLAACGGATDTELTTEDSLRSCELALRAREAAETGKKLVL